MIKQNAFLKQNVRLGDNMKNSSISSLVYLLPVILPSFAARRHKSFAGHPGLLPGKKFGQESN